MNPDSRPIAVFDSGVGGLSILREVRAVLSHEDILYFADQGHVPYGPRPLAQIQGFVRGIVRFFLKRGAKSIVIACNAASGAGLHHARELFPDIPIVGMEPAIKPAAEKTRNGTIGVITTKATYQGELFASVVDRFAKDMRVVTQVCPEFVRLVEQGTTSGDEVKAVAQGYLAPLLEAGIDKLVIGCTHFPFLTPVLQEIVGPTVEIIDPGPAIARRTAHVVQGMQNDPTHVSKVAYVTSGDLDHFVYLAKVLIGDGEARKSASHIDWLDDETLDG